MGVKKLPFDAEIEYLQSRGAQYIDTGIIANLQTSVDVKFAFTQIFDDNTVISMDSGSVETKSFTLEYFSSYGIVFSLDGKIGAVRTFITPTVNTIYTVTAKNNNTKVNGTLYRNFSAPYSFTGDYPLFMFAYGRNNSPIIYGKSKIYYCKIYNNGVLVRDFIPVRVGQVGYMYDKVSGQLFGNAGADSFILGQDI